MIGGGCHGHGVVGAPTNAVVEFMAAPKVFVLTVEIHIHRVVEFAADMKVLEDYLKKEVVKLQLTQGPEHILLAQLTTSLSRILFPKQSLKCLPHGTELELLMTPTSRFQSAIGPRIELSTRMVAELCSQDDSMLVTHNLCSNNADNIQHKQPSSCYCEQYSSKVTNKFASKPCFGEQYKSKFTKNFSSKPNYGEQYISKVTKCFDSNSCLHNSVNAECLCPSYSSANRARSSCGYCNRNDMIGSFRAIADQPAICDICCAYDRIMKKQFPCSLIGHW